MLELKEVFRRVRAGDQDAAAQLVSQYEPTIRGIVRTYLNDPQLRRLLGSDDVCQSVLLKLFEQIRTDQFELDDPERLRAYLCRMVRNKIFSKTRWYHADRRDIRRTKGERGLDALPDAQATPGQVAERNEEFAKARAEVSESDWFLLKEKATGRTFHELGKVLGRKTDAVRMKYHRAMQKIKTS